MDELAKRFAALTPEQRALLELRLRRKGLQTSPADSATAPADVEPADASAETTREDPEAWRSRPPARPLRFGLYFFSDDGARASNEKYRLVLESAQFADRHGFCAVWTPERHFQDFGGLYPNPAVLSAALAVLTEHVEIRAGSCALPLHHPVRVAEEWAVVDNLSKGRVGVSFASGWHPDDFVFAPAAFADRKEVMFRGIELIQRLWAGESALMTGVDGAEVAVKVLPRPVQPRLPVWVTSAGNAATWERAGAIGANVLAAYIGYAPEELGARIVAYRAARARHGHDPDAGIVSIMLHTFVGPDERALKAQVRAPFSHYLRSYFKQYEHVRVETEAITEADKEALAAAAFEHYFATSTLLGTPAKCARLLDQLAALGADEVACLIDFGLDTDTVLSGLNYLDELRAHFAPTRARRGRDVSSAARPGSDEV